MKRFKEEKKRPQEKDQIETCNLLLRIYKMKRVNICILLFLLGATVNQSVRQSTNGSCVTNIDRESVRLNCNSMCNKTLIGRHGKSLSSDNCKVNNVCALVNTVKRLTVLTILYGEADDSMFDQLREFKYLEKFWLLHNSLTKIPVNLCVKMPHVIEINLSHNDINIYIKIHIDTESFNGLKQLKRIDLSNNKIAYLLNEIDWPSSLEYLNLCYNEIGAIHCSALPGSAKTHLSCGLQCLLACTDCNTHPNNYPFLLYRWMSLNKFCWFCNDARSNLCLQVLHDDNNDNKQITVANGHSKEVQMMNTEKQKDIFTTTPMLLTIICILFLILIVWFVYNVVMCIIEKRKFERRRQNAKNRASANQNLMTHRKAIENVYTLA